MHGGGGSDEKSHVCLHLGLTDYRSLSLASPSLPFYMLCVISFRRNSQSFLFLFSEETKKCCEEINFLHHRAFQIINLANSVITAFLMEKNMTIDGPIVRRIFIQTGGHLTNNSELTPNMIYRRYADYRWLGMEIKVVYCQSLFSE